MNPEQDTNMNFASSKSKLGSSDNPWRIPSAAFVYEYRSINARPKAGCIFVFLPFSIVSMAVVNDALLLFAINLQIASTALMDSLIEFL